jgi:hypothetical protein
LSSESREKHERQTSTPQFGGGADRWRRDSGDHFLVPFADGQEAPQEGPLAGPRSLDLPPLEPIRRQRHVDRRGLDVAVTQVTLQRPGVLALIRELEAAGVPQHVRMHRERQLGKLTRLGNHVAKPPRHDDIAALRDEHEP